MAGWVTPPNSNQRAFVTNGTTMTVLGTLGGSYSTGYAINDLGQVAGLAVTNILGQAEHAFLYSGGTMQDLGTLGGIYSLGLGINNSAQVTGMSFVDPNMSSGTGFAFLYTNGAMQNLGPVGAIASQGYAINASGQVTGYADLSGGTGLHAFISNGTSMLDLGTLGGVDSKGEGINASGQVTGQAVIATNEEHAFLYTNGSMFDLNSLISGNPLSLFVTLQEGTAINDSGWIVANGVDSRSGFSHAYLLIPSP